VRTLKRLRESAYLCVFVCFCVFLCVFACFCVFVCVFVCVASNPVLAEVCVYMKERDRNDIRARERAKGSERASMCEFVCV